jgi:hypothetical protein
VGVRAVARRNDRVELLEATPVADEVTYLRHMTAFVEAFVLAARRERWLYLLREKPKRAPRDAHKLRNDLDVRWCTGPWSYGDDLGLTQDGVYYEFFGEPHVLSPAEAESIGTGRDAIYSVVPGRLAVFFFHEFETWLCRR